MNITMIKGTPIRVFASFLIMLVVFALLTFVLETTYIGAKANADDVIYSTCGMPTIDGNVSLLEWSNASSMTIQMISPGAAPPFTTTLHVMNSQNYLFMGFTIDDDEFSTAGQFLPEGDVFVIIFDNDHSGSIYDLNNNVVALSAGNPKYEDRYIINNLIGSNQEDPLGGGTPDGTGSTSRVNDLNHFEMKFPLCSGDTLDFCLSSTDVVGFRLEYLDAEGNGSFGGSQFYPGTDSTSQADLVIGTCTTISDIFAYLPLILK